MLSVNAYKEHLFCFYFFTLMLKMLKNCTYVRMLLLKSHFKNQIFASYIKIICTNKK